MRSLLPIEFKGCLSRQAAPEHLSPSHGDIASWVSSDSPPVERNCNMERRYFLECHSAPHRIYIPRPTLEESGPNPKAIVRVGRRVAFVCTHCGSVSSYSDREIREEQTHHEDMFCAGIYRLHYLKPKCDATQCVEPCRIHLVRDSSPHGPGSDMSARRKLWKNDGTAMCSAVPARQLSWDGGTYDIVPCESPF